MKLEKYLHLYRITQTEFAKEIGISLPHLNNILKGKRNASIPLGEIIDRATRGKVSFKDLYNEKAPSKFKRALMDEEI